MKKTITLLLLLFVIISYSQTTIITDSIFEQALIDAGIDSDLTINGEVLTSDVSDETLLDIEGLGVVDLTGIEDFTSLVTLKANNNNLTTLDLTNNVNLETIQLASNNLTNIDLSQNVNLNWLWLDNNSGITSLDLTNNTNLTTLYADNLNLNGLDVTQNLNLSNLRINYNVNLGSIDVTNNTQLGQLYVVNTGLSNLDISNNTLLYEVRCDFNNLTTLDLTNLTSLRILYGRGNNFNTLDFTNQNILLAIYVENNNLTDLLLPQSANSFSYIFCSSNNLTSLDLSQFPNLRYVSCFSNQLTELNIKNGNNTLMNSSSKFRAFNNPNLACIQVDDAQWSTNTWTQVDSGVTFSEDCSTLSTDDLVMEDMEFFPNPVSTTLNVNTKEDLSYSIIDITGKELMSGELSNGLNNIDLSKVSSGMLFVKVTDGEGVLVKKIVKK